MSQLQSIRRVTIYSAGGDEAALIDEMLHLGAKGYTVMECRGHGVHGVVDDPLRSSSQHKIEFLVRPEVAAKIMDHLHDHHLKHEAVTATLETVEASTNESF